MIHRGNGMHRRIGAGLLQADGSAYGRSSRTARAVPIMLLVALFAQAAVGDDREAISIAEFVEAKSRWDRLVSQPMRLEGRISLFSNSELRFKKCDMRFVHSSLIRPGGSTKNVEVGGRIVRKDGKLTFSVTELKLREQDMDLLARKRAVINNSRPDGAYELAAWARRRGDFYDDDELRDASKSLYEEGLTIGHQHLKPGDVAGLRDLAKKAAEFSLGDGLRLQFLHEANRLEWKSEQDADLPNYRRVLDLIRRELPGATSPLPRHRLAIRKEYKRAPETYRLASEQNRRLLARAFYLEVATAEIGRAATEDGSNGYEIARRVERELPELTDLADTYRTRELRYLDRRLDRLTRPQVLDLSERYKQRNDPQQAGSVVRRWLELREPRARENGPAELMELGDEYVTLLNDERAAAKLYKLAFERNPQSKTAADWLRDHGYTLRESTWSKPGERQEDPHETTIAEAIQEGRVQVGMTAQQARKALGTKPASVVRMASAGHIEELWVFPDYGITVRLKRRSTSDVSLVVQTTTID